MIYKKGDSVKAQVTDIDIEKERISLSVKALEKDPFSDTVSGLKRGQPKAVAASFLISEKSSHNLGIIASKCSSFTTVDNALIENFLTCQ